MKTGFNITYRKDGRYEARYIKDRTADGKAVYGYCYGKTYEEASQKRAAALIKLNNSGIVEPRTVSEVFEDWMKTITPETTPRYKIYRQTADNYILPEFSRRPITELSDMSLHEFLHKLSKVNPSQIVRNCYETLFDMCAYAASVDYLNISPIEEGSISGKFVESFRRTRGGESELVGQILTDEQAVTLNNELNINKTPRKLGIYLCLNMGLAPEEVCALTFGDINIATNTVTVNKSVIATSKLNDEIVYKEERVIPMPKYVSRYVTEASDWYGSPSDPLIFEENQTVSKPAMLHNELFSINKMYSIAFGLSLKMLRDTFICHCLRNNVDLFVLSKYTGIRNVNDIMKKFSDYVQSDMSVIENMVPFSADQAILYDGVKKLNLLILGAGGQGHVVKELAEDIGVFDKISFLDDNIQITEAIDVCDNYYKYLAAYPVAYPSFGNNTLRSSWVERLEKAGFILPRLIHPSATISNQAEIGRGTVVEAKAIINAGTHIGKGCIISAGAIVDHNVTVEDNSHLDCASTVKKNSVVHSLTKVPSGTVFDNAE